MRIINVDTKKYSELDTEEPEMIVLHHFERYDHESKSSFRNTDDIVDFLSESDYEVSANAVIDTNGDVYKIVPEAYASWHAGKSHLHGRHINHSINKMSYGIEVIRSQEHGYEFTSAQYLATAELCRDICSKYRITAPWIASHAMVRAEYNEYAKGAGLDTAEKKNDPLGWDWKLYYELIYSVGLDRYSIKLRGE